jgi:thiol-disulfide isomerase/thioredoxin
MPEVSSSRLLASLHPRARVRLPVEGTMPPLTGATGWLNSEPLTPGDLRGNVVLVDFWTYTCINWLRQLPYVRAWTEKYRDHGLVTIGVHTPEFEFEQDEANVRRAVAEMRVDYPVALDSDYAIWSAFDNHYWPAIYVVDASGQIRHHRFGEGEYDETEMIIQYLLDESGLGGVSDEMVSVEGDGIEAPADWRSLRSPENYLGSDRTQNFVSAGTPLRLNEWSLTGDWAIGRGAVVLNEPGGAIQNRFHARDLHLVMGPSTDGVPVRFQVLVDGQPPGADHGGDVGEDGSGVADYRRVYQLIRQRDVADRTFDITFLDAGAAAYSFTFG